MRKLPDGTIEGTPSEILEYTELQQGKRNLFKVHPPNPQSWTPNTGTGQPPPDYRDEGGTGLPPDEQRHVDYFKELMQEKNDGCILGTPQVTCTDGTYPGQPISNKIKADMAMWPDKYSYNPYKDRGRE